MDPCLYAITALASALADGRNTDEIDLLSSIFLQIGDTLATIAAKKVLSEKLCDQQKTS